MTLYEHNTNGITTGNTALCTIVHRAIKMTKLKQWQQLH